MQWQAEHVPVLDPKGQVMGLCTRALSRVQYLQQLGLLRLDLLRQQIVPVVFEKVVQVLVGGVIEGQQRHGQGQHHEQNQQNQASHY